MKQMYLKFEKISDLENIFGWQTIEIIGQRLAYTRTTEVTDNKEFPRGYTIRSRTYEYLAICDGDFITFDADEFAECIIGCYKLIPEVKP